MTATVLGLGLIIAPVLCGAKERVVASGAKAEKLAGTFEFTEAPTCDAQTVARRRCVFAAFRTTRSRVRTTLDRPPWRAHRVGETCPKNPARQIVVQLSCSDPLEFALPLGRGNSPRSTLDADREKGLIVGDRVELDVRCLPQPMLNQTVGNR